MRLAAATLVFAVLGLVGCGGGTATNTRSASGLPPAGGGGNLSYAVPGLPATVDPLTARGHTALTISRQIHEPLIERLTGPYGQGTPEAGLAVTAKPSPDRTTWVLTLRPGVRFQDGTPFNAAAVLANSRRWQSEEVGRRLLPHLFAVDAPRPDEVRFLLDRPVPDLERRLADPRLGIVSPRALDPQNGSHARFVAGASGSGTGAFQAGARGPARLVLNRSSGWWGSAHGLGPSLDGATFVVAPLTSQRLRLLQEGAVQVAGPLGSAALRAVERDPLLTTADPIGMERSVRGIDAGRSIPVLSDVWLTNLIG